MDKIIIEKIIRKMKSELTEEQLSKLTNVCYEISKESGQEEHIDYIEQFIASKKVEGCSKRTSEYYSQVLKYFEKNMNLPLCSVTTDKIRTFLADYQHRNKCTNVTLDNIRRILSSFYKWLESEDYIIKSPMSRIHKVKAPIVVKSIFTDEELELLRADLSGNARNIAILNLLISSGIRIGELVNLNINDINLTNKTGIVRGKGNKERVIYFDVKTKLSIEKYLSKRTDDNPALFVSSRSYKKIEGKKRISINNTETIIRNSGNSLNITKAHPHKFRRTVATKAIDKGMPIEQVQLLLGHSKIDTTLHYAQVQQRNVMLSYQKFIC